MNSWQAQHDTWTISTIPHVKHNRKAVSPIYTAWPVSKQPYAVKTSSSNNAGDERLPGWLQREAMLWWKRASVRPRLRQRLPMFSRPSVMLRAAAERGYALLLFVSLFFSYLLIYLFIIFLFIFIVYIYIFVASVSLLSQRHSERSEWNKGWRFDREKVLLGITFRHTNGNMRKCGWDENADERGEERRGGKDGDRELTDYTFVAVAMGGDTWTHEREKKEEG